MNPVTKWSVDDVSQWLESINLGEYVNLLCKKHKIDGEVLLTLGEYDLRNPPIGMSVFGDVKRLILGICKLQEKYQLPPTRESQLKLTSSQCKSHSAESSTSDEELAEIFLSGRDLRSSPYEIRRVALSFVYLFISCYTTAVVMTIVHNRVPDMKKYPPLPDLILESLPLIPWGFKASEIIILNQFIVWCGILVFHRHRFILFKRYCNIFGSVFLLRCCTLLFTSLSVPGTHHDCVAQKFNGWRETLVRSVRILCSGGLSVNGITTCGDYMFSGHTVAHTLMTLFITEYTPQRFALLHLISRICTAFGIFFILAAHEHYTLDVICAFYVALRTFSHYHVLITAHKVNRHLTKCWNPVFYYMEKPLEYSFIPNEYESPFIAIRRWWSHFREKKHPL